MEINNDAVNEDVESVGQLSEHQSQDDNQNQDDCEAKEEVEKDVEMNIDINDDESDQLINPLSLLIKAAKIMNPKQFQLPNELTPTIQLVGTSKKIIPWNRSSKKPPLHELDNGLVPLPVKTCFQCGMSCRKAPLIQCDYCVLLFHPDCLDPPLTCLPTGRWMCPNHAQHAIESKLLDSVSLTERIKLLDQFAGNLSQDVVKIDFLKKIHRKNPPFRCKLLGPPPERVLVPRAIKDMYKNPSPLLPKASSAHSFQQQNVLFKTEIKTEFKSELDKPSLEEQEEWLSSVIAFQGQVAKHLSLQRLQKEMKQNKSNSENSEPFSSSPSSTSSIITNRTSNDISSSFKLPNEKVMSKLMNGPVTVNHVTNNNRHLEPLEFNKNGIDNGVDMNIKIKSEMNGSKSPTSSSSSPVQAQHDKKINYSSPTCATINLNSMPVHIDDINDIELSKLDDKIMKVLAWQRLQQLIHAKSSQPENNSQNLVSPSSSSNSNSNSTTPQTPQTTVKRICLGDVKARAVLCPVFIRSSNGALNTNSSGPAIAMSYRTLTIGTGADNDVILGNYGQCMYVSGHHACIFYDEIHNPKYASIDSHTVVAIKEVIKRGRKSKLELKRKAKELKFKEDNCEDDGEADDEMPVDGRVKKAKKMTKESVAGNVVAKASNNGQAAVKQLPSKPSRSSIKEGKDESNVNANVERISVQVQGLGHNNHVAPTMSSRVGSNCKSCACKASFSTLIGGSGAGWEGTAVLRHGSYIKIVSAMIHTEDSCNFVISNGGAQTFHLRAATEVDRQNWVTALELAKAKACRMMDSEEDEEYDISNDKKELQSVVKTLGSKLETLHSCHDVVIKHGAALQRSLIELEQLESPSHDSMNRSKTVNERATLFRITSSAMINACTEYLTLAQTHGKKWQKMLQHEHEARLHLEELVEQLAKQHSHLEQRAIKQAGNSNSNASKVNATNSDDDEFYDAEENTADFVVTFPGKAHRIKSNESLNKNINETKAPPRKNSLGSARVQDDEVSGSENSCEECEESAGVITRGKIKAEKPSHKDLALNSLGETSVSSSVTSSKANEDDSSNKSNSSSTPTTPITAERKNISFSNDSSSNSLVKGTWDNKMEVAKVVNDNYISKGNKPMIETATFKTIWKRNYPPPEYESMYNMTLLAVQLNEHEDNVAPTDSRLRPDQRLMEEGKWDEANQMKSFLEDKQRSVRRIREEESERAAQEGRPFMPYQPVWFEKDKDPITGNPVFIYNNKYWESKERQDWSRCPDIFGS
ncbi:unnamed protein product [Sphagnum balticum]